ncbi:MAG TPA: BMP family ABC transporter substrate-binding protein [Anaerolineales bacterium]|jgi:basic membrane protein A
MSQTPTHVPLQLRALLLFALVQSSCAAGVNDCARLEVFCVGLVTDTGGLHDHGLTQSAWDQLERAQAGHVAQITAYVESVDPRDYAKNLEYFARRHYDVVLSAGAGFRDETLFAADRYPATIFVGLDQPPDPAHPNYVAVTFHEDQAGFLAGYLAARMTRTGIVAAVCETAGIPSNWRACEGFRAGAAYADPDVQVLITYRENGSQEDLFRDDVWGRAAALESIAAGADVIFGVGGGTGQGALVAAAERGVAALGSEQDQFQVTRAAQAVLLTSFVKNADPAIPMLLSALINGGAHQSEYSGSIAIAPFQDRGLRVPQPVQTNLIQLASDLSRNIVTTGIPPQAP